MAHTPGPWQRSGMTVRAGDTNVAQAAFNFASDTSYADRPWYPWGKTWARASEDTEWHGGGPLEREAEANAKLIASAPEMLQALEALVAAIDNVDLRTVDDSGLTYDQIVWAQAEAAIAKAKGVTVTYAYRIE
jgi:hypothetical protein